MNQTINLDSHVLTEKKKAVISYLSQHHPDILDYYAQNELEELINQRIDTYYLESESLILSGMQATEAEEIANKNLLTFQTSFSKLEVFLTENYGFSIDTFEAETREKMLYFSKEYRSQIDSGVNISTLVDAFFLV